MTKEQLLETAREIPKVSSEALDEYAARREQMVGMMNETMLARPDVSDLVGENNLDIMKDNHANHARFVESILRKPDADTLVETCLWVFRAYRSRGFHSNYWSAQLNNWVAIVKETLNPSAAEEVYPLYHWFVVHIPDFTALSDAQMDEMDVSHEF